MAKRMHARAPSLRLEPAPTPKQRVRRWAARAKIVLARSVLVCFGPAIGRSVRCLRSAAPAVFVRICGEAVRGSLDVS